MMVISWVSLPALRKVTVEGAFGAGAFGAGAFGAGAFEAGASAVFTFIARVVFLADMVVSHKKRGLDYQPPFCHSAGRGVVLAYAEIADQFLM